MLEGDADDCDKKCRGQATELDGEARVIEELHDVDRSGYEKNQIGKHQ